MTSVGTIETLPRDFEVIFTNHGEELLARHPELRDAFGEAIQQETGTPQGPYKYDHIGSGGSARVSAIPGYEDICIKLSHPMVGRDAYNTGRPGDPEDLITQVKFMDSLQQWLDGRDQYGVSAPQYYLAAASRRAVYVSIQQKLPENVISLGAYLGLHKMRENADTICAAVNDRVKQAVGRSPLRLGIDDIWRNGTTNTGNVLLSQDEKSPENAQLYVIDLPHRRTKVARAALWFANRTNPA